MRINRDFYDYQFFETETYGHKTYIDENGKITNSTAISYRNQWDEWPKIFNALRQLFKFTSIIDIGCGCAHSVLKARDLGYKAFGVDYSDAAMKLSWSPSFIVQAETRALPFHSNSFDLAISSSVFEHLYIDEITLTLSEIARITRKLFVNIDGVVNNESYALNNNVEVPNKLLFEAIKGHVTMQTYNWWRNEIEKYFILRDDLLNEFLKIVPSSFRPESFKFICERKT